MKFELEVNSDEFDVLLVSRLQETYIDHVTRWMFEPDAENVAESLLTVLQLFMVKREFDDWYESVKEL